MLSMENDYVENEYYTYNRRLFRLIGFYQRQTSSKNIIYICFINFIIIFAVFVQIHFLAISEWKLMPIAKLLETILPTLCFGFCYYNILFNNEIMKKILYRIKFDWDELANKPELVILKKYAEISRMCTIIIAVSLYLYSVFLIFPSLLSMFRYISGDISVTELILPIRADYFLKNLIFYYIGLTIECVTISILCTIGIANYTMFIVIIQHACALFTIVQWRIKERFEKSPSNSYYADVKNELLDEKEWIVAIIKFYKHAIEFVDLLKSFYEFIHLFEELLWFIFILIDYFYIFNLTFNRTEAILKLLYVISSFFVIFVYSYLSQQLIDHNFNVFIILCQIPFYSLSLRTQKLLPLLIMNSMRQCSLSLTSAIVISHNLFATSIKKSLSFAAMLFNLQ